MADDKKRRSKIASALRGAYYGGIEQPMNVLIAVGDSATSERDFKESLDLAKKRSTMGKTLLSVGGTPAEHMSDNPMSFQAGQIAGNIATTLAPAGAATKAIGAAGQAVKNIPAFGRALQAIGSGKGITGTLGQGAVQGAVSTGMTEGDLGSGAAGGALGGAAFGVGGRLIQPFRQGASAIRQGYADTLKRAGIDDLTPGQLTGSMPMQTTDSVLANMPFTAGAESARKEGQLRKFTQEAMRSAGVDAQNPNFVNTLKQLEMTNPDINTQAIVDAVTNGTFGPNVRGGVEKVFKKRYGDLINNETVKIDDAALDKVADIYRSQFEKLPTNVRPVVQSYLKDIAQSGGQFNGQAYQTARSQLSQQARSMQNTDPFTANVLRDIRGVLDGAAERSLPADKKGAWSEVNRHYGNYKTLQKAGSRVSGDSLEGLITPGALMQTVETANKGKGQAGYGDLYDLARAGRAILPDGVPNSGTAQRQLVQGLLTGGVGTGIGVAGGLDPQTAALMGLGLVGGPKAVQFAMNSPAGRQYLTQGVPGLNQLIGKTGALGPVAGAQAMGNNAPQSDFEMMQQSLQQQSGLALPMNDGFDDMRAALSGEATQQPFMPRNDGFDDMRQFLQQGSK